MVCKLYRQMSDIIVRILFISYFIKLHVALEENFTYVNTPLSWIEASRYCENIGLVLANNKIDIENSLQHSSNQNQQVWLGEYEELTEWAYIKGCFNTDWGVNKKSTTVGQGDRLTCQKLCKEHMFFSEKKGICSCYDSLTNYSRCNCSDSYCVTIWKRLLGIFSDDKSRNCIVVTGCDGSEVTRSLDNCDTDLQTTCDNGETLGYGTNSQSKSAEMCFERGSFIKWYTDADCLGELTTQHRWTSGKRKIQRFSIVKNVDEVDVRRLLKCFSYDGKTEDMHNKDECQEDEKTFFCQKENSDDWLLSKAEVSFEQKQSSSVGIVLGVVFVVIGMAVAGAILVVYIKRRTKKKSDAQLQTRNPSSVSNFGYNFHVTQSNKIKTQGTDYDYPRVTGLTNDKNLSVNYSLAKAIEEEKGGDYSFAQPIDSDSAYAYNSDYDHLNTTMTQSNDSEHYMSAGQAKRKDDKMGTYNYLSSFDRKTNDEESCSNSNYDHLPTITGSNPTYDVSGNVTHDDSDKYDHLPPNFKGDTSSEYQSTTLFPGSVKDEAYDHFELKDVT